MLPYNRYRKQFAIFYFACFAVTYTWLFFNHLLISQLNPVFFVNKLDLSRNILMLTNLQHLLIGHPAWQVLADVLYIVAPGLLLSGILRDHRGQFLMALFVCGYNFAYAMMISSMSTLSIEGYIGWILIPLVFVCNTTLNYQYMLRIMRYFFILVFVSAAIWKFRAGGIFNVEQMSAILLKQHTSYLVSEPSNWFSRVIFFLSRHAFLSWSIYAVATLAELVFIIGFFTKKFDNLLIVIFIAFVLFNYFFMRINYMSWIAFTGCFWFAYRQDRSFGNAENTRPAHSIHTINI